MEKMADGEKKKKPTRNKPPIIRRRGTKYARKFINIGAAHHQQDYVVNYMAKARSEIGHALQLHRSSSSSKMVSTNYTMICSSGNVISNGATSSSSSVGHDHYHNKCFKMEPAYYLPLSQPIWSTTSPTIFPSTTSTSTSTSTSTTSVPLAASAMKQVDMGLDDDEFDEWLDQNNDIASSYSWWIGFLESLDKGGGTDNYDTNIQKHINKEECSLSSLGHINNGDEDSTNQKNGEPASLQEVEPTDEWWIVQGFENSD